MVQFRSSGAREMRCSVTEMISAGGVTRYLVRVRQGNEFLSMAGHGVDAASLPVCLCLFDPFGPARTGLNPALRCPWIQPRR
jgi:hypothetical protein